MSLVWEQVVVDSTDPSALARWWAKALDFRPIDQQAEVTRLIGLGATLADIGQGDTPWAVLADPEGNEFCVLAASAHT